MGHGARFNSVNRGGLLVVVQADAVAEVLLHSRGDVVRSRVVRINSVVSFVCQVVLFSVVVTGWRFAVVVMVHIAEVVHTDIPVICVVVVGVVRVRVLNHTRRVVVPRVRLVRRLVMVVHLVLGTQMLHVVVLAHLTRGHLVERFNVRVSLRLTLVNVR